MSQLPKQGLGNEAAVYLRILSQIAIETPFFTLLIFYQRNFQNADSNQKSGNLRDKQQLEKRTLEFQGLEKCLKEERLREETLFII